MARGIHLFPSRTEKLSLATPMVLRNSGRVGSRRLCLKTPVHSVGRESFFVSLYLDFCFTEKIKDLLFGVDSGLCEYKRNYHND